jgi:hypothetical protein
MQKLTDLGGSTITLFERIAHHPDIQEFLGKARQFLDEKVIPALSRLWAWIRDKVMPVLVEVQRDHIARMQEALRGLQQKVDDNRDELEQYWGALKKVANFIAIKVIPVILELYSRYLSRLVKGIGLVIEWISFCVNEFNKMRSAVSWVGDKIDWLVTKGNSLKKRLSFSGIFDGLKSAFRSAINWIIGKWNDFHLTLGGGSILGKDIPSITLSTPNIPYLAQGGIVPATPGGRLVRAGEGGQDEAIAPLSKLAGMLRDAIRDGLRDQVAGKRPLVENLNVRAYSDRFSLSQVMDDLAMHGVH